MGRPSLVMDFPPRSLAPEQKFWPPTGPDQTSRPPASYWATGLFIYFSSPFGGIFFEQKDFLFSLLYTLAVLSFFHFILAVLGLPRCMGSSLVAESGGYFLFIVAVRGLFTEVASLIVEHGL